MINISYTISIMIKFYELKILEKNKAKLQVRCEDSVIRNLNYSSYIKEGKVKKGNIRMA